MWAEAVERLGSAVDARRIVEEASGMEPSEWVLRLEEPAPVPAARRAASMVERREAGEPLQYVLGRWGFRSLDLIVDKRVLIPRPETEGLVEAALVELGRQAQGPGSIAVDLGTGSGAVALALAHEEPTVEVWGVDASDRALAVARANLAGLGGSVAKRVRLVSGNWFSALPSRLRGRVGVVASNPPYVALHEVPDLPPEVGDWEPRDALLAGPTGTEMLCRIIDESRSWLRPDGAVVLEMAPQHAGPMSDRARAAGFSEVDVLSDLAGRPRVLVGRI